jgi:opacity protein-like surface antigen
MRAATILLAVAVAAGVPATAKAQTTTTTAPAPSTAPYTSSGSTGQWFASGFVGSNFGASLHSDLNLDDVDINNDNNNSSFEFGGNIGYAWNRVVGVEFLADFTPSFGISNNFNIADANRLVDDPRVSTYMFNAIAGVPISAGRFEPYVSGGVGGVTLAADVLDNVLDPNGPSSRSSVTRFGGNIGGGVYTFAGNIGFRADIRYFRAATDNNRTATIVADRIAEDLVGGLSLWRANVGIAFRW